MGIIRLLVCLIYVFVIFCEKAEADIFTNKSEGSDVDFLENLSVSSDQSMNKSLGNFETKFNGSVQKTTDEEENEDSDEDESYGLENLFENQKDVTEKQDLNSTNSEINEDKEENNLQPLTPEERKKAEKDKKDLEKNIKKANKKLKSIQKDIEKAEKKVEKEKTNLEKAIKKNSESKKKTSQKKLDDAETNLKKLEEIFDSQQEIIKKLNVQKSNLEMKLNLNETIESNKGIENNQNSDSESTASSDIEKEDENDSTEDVENDTKISNSEKSEENNIQPLTPEERKKAEKDKKNLEKNLKKANKKLKSIQKDIEKAEKKVEKEKANLEKAIEKNSESKKKTSQKKLDDAETNLKKLKEMFDSQQEIIKKLNVQKSNLEMKLNLNETIESNKGVENNQNSDSESTASSDIEKEDENDSTEDIENDANKKNSESKKKGVMSKLKGLFSRKSKKNTKSTEVVTKQEDEEDEDENIDKSSHKMRKNNQYAVYGGDIIDIDRDNIIGISEKTRNNKSSRQQRLKKNAKNTANKEIYFGVNLSNFLNEDDEASTPLNTTSNLALNTLETPQINTISNLALNTLETPQNQLVSTSIATQNFVSQQSLNNQNTIQNLASQQSQPVNDFGSNQQVLNNQQQYNATSANNTALAETPQTASISDQQIVQPTLYGSTVQIPNVLGFQNQPIITDITNNYRYNPIWEEIGIQDPNIQQPLNDQYQMYQQLNNNNMIVDMQQNEILDQMNQRISTLEQQFANGALTNSSISQQLFNENQYQSSERNLSDDEVTEEVIKYLRDLGVLNEAKLSQLNLRDFGICMVCGNRKLVTKLGKEQHIGICKDCLVTAIANAKQGKFLGRESSYSRDFGRRNGGYSESLNNKMFGGGYGTSRNNTSIRENREIGTEDILGGLASAALGKVLFKNEGKNTEMNSGIQMVLDANGNLVPLATLSGTGAPYGYVRDINGNLVPAKTLQEGLSAGNAVAQAGGLNGNNISSQSQMVLDANGNLVPLATLSETGAPYGYVRDINGNLVPAKTLQEGLNAGNTVAQARGLNVNNISSQSQMVLDANGNLVPLATLSGTGAPYGYVRDINGNLVPAKTLQEGLNAGNAVAQAKGLNGNNISSQSQISSAQGTSSLGNNLVNSAGQINGTAGIGAGSAALLGGAAGIGTGIAMNQQLQSSNSGIGVGNYDGTMNNGGANLVISSAGTANNMSTLKKAAIGVAAGGALALGTALATKAINKWKNKKGMQNNEEMVLNAKGELVPKSSLNDPNAPYGYKKDANGNLIPATSAEEAHAAILDNMVLNANGELVPKDSLNDPNAPYGYKKDANGNLVPATSAQEARDAVSEKVTEESLKANNANMVLNANGELVPKDSLNDPNAPFGYKKDANGNLVPAMSEEEARTAVSEKLTEESKSNTSDKISKTKDTIQKLLKGAGITAGATAALAATVSAYKAIKKYRDDKKNDPEYQAKQEAKKAEKEKKKLNKSKQKLESIKKDIKKAEEKIKTLEEQVTKAKTDKKRNSAKKKLDDAQDALKKLNDTLVAQQKIVDNLEGNQSGKNSS